MSCSRSYKKKKKKTTKNNQWLEDAAFSRTNERKLFEIHHTASDVIPNTLEMMKWELSKTGMIIQWLEDAAFSMRVRNGV
jgi:hypothetical protein